jgi:hypothetical protein
LSKIALSGNASGTGTFTLASPNSNSDRTVNLPDAGGDMVLTTATQTLTNKDIVATQLTGDVAAARITTALNASGSAPIFAARAWVNFDGTGTVTIRASGNVSSITDGGTGVYTVNFTTAMPDTDYAMVGTPSSGDTASIPGGLMQSTATGGADFTRTTSSITVRNARASTGAAADAGSINIAIFR